MVQEAFDRIISPKSNDDSNQILEHIRNYASRLDKLKNDFLISAGINENKLYNVTYNDEQLDKIINAIINDLRIIIKERL